MEVVCKVLKKHVRSGQLANFWKEVSILAHLRFPHLLQFLGACTDPEHLIIITEFMAQGSLFELLHTHHIQFTWAHILRIGSLCCIALHYCAVIVVIREHYTYSPFNQKSCAITHSTSLCPKLTTAREIALGMNYLHTRRPQILHRDLTSSNILLDAKFTAKVHFCAVIYC